MNPRIPLAALLLCSAMTALADPIAKGEEMCRDTLTTMVRFKDPYSVKIDAVLADPILRSTKYMGSPVMGRNYTLMVNAKNAYGAYAGAKPIVCTVDQAVSRVIGYNTAAFD